MKLCNLSMHRFTLALLMLAPWTQSARAEVWISSRSDDRVAAFSDEGVYLGDFITAGSGGLDGPVGLRLHPTTGELLVASNQSNEILRYDRFTGAPLSPAYANTNLNGPSDLAFAPNGDLYVANFGTTPIGGGTNVVTFDSSGQPAAYIADFGSGNDNPTGVVFGNSGDVYVTNFDFFNQANNYIEIYDSAGTSQGTLTHANLNGPAGLTLNPNDGKLYVASLLLDGFFQNYVLRFDLNTMAGEVVLSGGDLFFPAGIQFMPNGDLLVSNSGDGRIIRYAYDEGTETFSPDGVFNDDGGGGGTGGLAEASQMLYVPDGDLNDDTVVDSQDIDILWNVIRPELAGDDDPGENDIEDLNQDGYVNEDDVDYLLAHLLTAGTDRQYGDADLDGGVGGLDYTAWRQRVGTGWANGDFDGDGGVGGLDYTLWRTRPTQYPTTVGPHPGGGGPAIVPEPAALVLLSLGLPAFMLAARRRTRP